MTENKHISNIIALALFLAVLLRLPFGDSLRVQFMWFFEAGITLAIAGYFYFRVNKSIAAFILLAFISRHFPNVPNTYSIEAFRWVLFGTVWYALVYEYAKTKPIFDVLCIVAVVNSVIIFCQALNIDTLFVLIDKSRGMTGIMANPNETGAFMAMCLPAFFRRKVWIWIPFILLSFIPGKSVGNAVVAFILCMFYVLWVHRDLISKRMITLAIALCFVGTVLFFGIVEHPAYKKRLSFPVELAQKTDADIWMKGVGIGNWKVVYVKAYMAKKLSSGRIRLHNTFLQNWIEMGVLSLIITLSYLIGILKGFDHKKYWMFGMALIAIVVCANINSMFRMNAINAMIAVTWLALTTSKCKEIT